MNYRARYYSPTPQRFVSEDPIDNPWDQWNSPWRNIPHQSVTLCHMNDTKNPAILVDFYPGAYGPTIRIVLNTRQQLQAFLDNLRSLASNEGVIIALEQLPNFALSGIASFVFQTVSSTPALREHLTVSGGHNPSVIWKQTRRDWKRAADLIEVFTTSDEPGHHYLTDEGVDDALVEVAYKE